MPSTLHRFTTESFGGLLLPRRRSAPEPPRIRFAESDSFLAPRSPGDPWTDRQAARGQHHLTSTTADLRRDEIYNS